MWPWPLLYRFCLPIPGPVSYGSWHQARELLVFAWGRETICDDELPQVSLRRSPRYDDANTIRVLREDGFDPGDPNRQLADVLSWALEHNTELLAYVQWEVAVAMENQKYRQYANRIRIIWPFVGWDEFNTLHVIDGAMQLGFMSKRCPPAILAHQFMVVRAALMLRKYLGGMHVIVFPSRVTMCSKTSVHYQTRNQALWYARELPGRWFICIPKHYV